MNSPTIGTITILQTNSKRPWKVVVVSSWFPFVCPSFESANLNQGQNWRHVCHFVRNTITILTSPRLRGCWNENFARISRIVKYINFRTPLKINMELKNEGLVQIDDFAFQTRDFQVPAVNFPGCTLKSFRLGFASDLRLQKEFCKQSGWVMETSGSPQ